MESGCKESWSIKLGEVYDIGRLKNCARKKRRDKRKRRKDKWI